MKSFEVCNRCQLIKPIYNATNNDEIFRTSYEGLIGTILSDQQNERPRFGDPHFCDWEKFLSNTELLAWRNIRSVPKLHLYPKFPVKNFIFDFANPIRRIGIFLDYGKTDFEDQVRFDGYLLTEGWKVFRIPVEKLNNNRDISDFDDYDILPSYVIDNVFEWLNDSFNGFCYSLLWTYFSTEDLNIKKFHNSHFLSLKIHQTVLFEIP